jgi:hypothetical protein
MTGIVICACALLLGGDARPMGAPRVSQQTRVNPDAKALADFQEDVDEYVKLHRKLEKKVGDLPTEADPAAVAKHQAALARLLQQARRGAKVGDIFERDVRPVFRKLLHGILSGPDGASLRAAIKEDNPGPALPLKINAPYPDALPVATMPSQVLKTLPPLPEELDYRFVGDSLILLDRHARIVVDILTGAVPR